MYLKRCASVRQPGLMYYTCMTDMQQIVYLSETNLIDLNITTDEVIASIEALLHERSRSRAWSAPMILPSIQGTNTIVPIKVTALMMARVYRTSRCLPDVKPIGVVLLMLMSVPFCMVLLAGAAIRGCRFP